jgi:hypothetical protein
MLKLKRIEIITKNDKIHNKSEELRKLKEI